MPINYKDYDVNWKVMSSDIIKRRAGERCELCGAPNKKIIFRLKHMGLWSLYRGDDSDKSVKIVLTVHHIDCDKKNNNYHNLIALCQRCHFRLDLGIHLKNRKINKIRRRGC